MEKGIVIAGAATGAAIPLILREYVDKETPAATFDWKKTSAMVGLGGGAVLTALGILGRRFLPDTISTFFVSAGPAMIVAGAYSAMFPKGGTAARLGGTAGGGIRRGSITGGRGIRILPTKKLISSGTTTSTPTSTVKTF